MKLDRLIEPLGLLSTAFIDFGATSLGSALDLVRKLPYGRNSNTSDPLIVLKEHKGTCSSKHLLIKRLAEEHSWTDVELILCLYMMTPENTPGIGDHLSKAGLLGIPEAHVFVRIQAIDLDVTSSTSSVERIKKEIVSIQPMSAQECAAQKANLHKRAMDILED